MPVASLRMTRPVPMTAAPHDEPRGAVPVERETAASSEKHSMDLGETPENPSAPPTDFAEEATPGDSFPHDLSGETRPDDPDPDADPSPPTFWSSDNLNTVPGATIPETSTMAAGSPDEADHRLPESDVGAENVSAGNESTAAEEEAPWTVEQWTAVLEAHGWPTRFVPTIRRWAAQHTWTDAVLADHLTECPDAAWASPITWREWADSTLDAAVVQRQG